MKRKLAHSTMIANEAGTSSRGESTPDSGQARLRDAFAPLGMLGQDPATLRCFRQLAAAAQQANPVLISGPRGSGKTLSASVLHRLRTPPPESIRVLNCACHEEDLSEKFHSLFEAPTPGQQRFPRKSLVLDEVSEIPLPLQATLFRWLHGWEETCPGRFSSPTEMFLVSTTSQELRAAVLAGRFREDLYYRLAVAQIRIPSLAARRADIPLLAGHILGRCNQLYGKNIRGFSEQAWSALLAYSWPGNLRELEDSISRGVAVAKGDRIGVDELCVREGPASTCGPPSAPEEVRPLSLRHVTREHIFKVLEFCGGNRVNAARILGIGRTSLYRFLCRERQHGPKA